MAASIKLYVKSGPLTGRVSLPISKSICNRLLILSKLSSQNYPQDQLSSADDSKLLFNALNSSDSIIHVENAGTAFRFLAAYFSIQPGLEVLLTGSEEMLERPIAPLVDAMIILGANIQYVGNEGFPPIKINGEKLAGGTVEIPSGVSSQFISALMLIGLSLENGLEIKLKGDSVSSSYLDMTRAVIQSCDGNISQDENQIRIEPSTLKLDASLIERDWSSASYFYGMVALRPNSEILMEGLKLDSVQGDRRIAEIMEHLGVQSDQTSHGVVIRSSKIPDSRKFKYDLSSEPDLVQTLVCVHAARGDEVFYTGIDHLRFKETDRLSALQSELKKFNVKFEEVNGGWNQTGQASWNGEAVSTFKDHRMAMAFSILTLHFRELTMEEPEVVSKSFPKYWTDLQQLGIITSVL